MDHAKRTTSRQVPMPGRVGFHGHRKMMKSISRLGLGLLLSVGLAACSEPQDGDTALEPELASSASATLVECPSNTTFENIGTVLPTGGAVSLRGHSVSFPLAALLLPTRIGIREPASQYMLIELNADGHEHFQFQEEVTVTISYARCSRADILRGSLSVWLVDPATGELLQNMGGVDNKLFRTVTFKTDHFSGYAIAN